MHGAHDEPLAFRVHTARGLIEDHDRRIMQQCARHGNALALATRKIRRILLDAHIEPLRMRVHHVEHMSVRERIAQFALRRAGTCHEQIVAQCAGEEVAARADNRDSAGQRTLAQFAQFHIPDAQCTVVPFELAGDERGERGFARA